MFNYEKLFLTIFFYITNKAIIMSNYQLIINNCLYQSMQSMSHDIFFKFAQIHQVVYAQKIFFLQCTSVNNIIALHSQ